MATRPTPQTDIFNPPAVMAGDQLAKQIEDFLSRFAVLPGQAQQPRMTRDEQRLRLRGE
jgi:hypothetical protein